MKKQRILYAAIFIVLLLIEIGIGLFVHDDFVRPYVGDVLVTVLLCCLCRVVIPTGMPLLPAYVFFFAVFVELTQYFDLVGRLGLENNALISTVVGRTFSAMDLLYYGVGCLGFWIAEKICISVGK